MAIHPYPRLALAFLAGVWVLAHPYEGFVHDAVLYAGQALRHLPDAGLRYDVFFQAASQDDYSLFGRLYATLLRYLDLPSAALALFVLGQGAWFCVSLAWLRAWTPGAALSLVAAFLALRHGYGPVSAFELAESFVTARLLAEPVALAGLLAGLRGRWATSVALLAVAFIVHPLVTLPVLGVLTATMFVDPERGRGGLVLFIGLAIAALVGAAAYSPKMDDEWLAVVLERVPGVLAGGWSWDQLARWSVPTTLLLVCAGRLPRQEATLCRAAALVGLLGIATAVIAYLACWALPIQLQTWRAMWICVWLAPLAVISVVTRCDALDRELRLRLLGALAASVLAQQSWIPGAAALALVYCVVTALALHDHRGWFDHGSPVGAAALAALVAFVALAGGAIGVAKLAGAPEYAVDRQVRTFAIHCLGWAVAGAVAWWATPALISRVRSRRRVALVTASVLVAAVLLSDARTPMAREAARWQGDILASWRERIPKDAVVLWPERLRHVWLGLRRSSYVSFEQGAGGIFDRGTAFEAQRRLGELRRIDSAETASRGATGPGAGSDAVSALERRCSLSPRPDFVVLPSVAGLGGRSAAAYAEAWTGTVYELHACGRSVRTGETTPP